MATISTQEEANRRRALIEDARLRQQQSAQDEAADELVFAGNLSSQDEQIRARRANDAFRRETLADRAARTAETVGDTAQRVGSTVETLGAASETGGKIGEAASRGLGTASRGAMTAGRSMMGAGAELTATGAGAIAGVPLAIAGAATTGLGAVGVGASAAGEGASRAAIAGGRSARVAGEELRQTGRGISQTAQALEHTPFKSLAQSSLGQMIAAPIDLGKDLKELFPSLTVIGIIVSVVRIHHRLIWGNLMNNQYLPAEPMANQAVWWSLVILLDLAIFASLMLITVLFYAILNPCEFFAGGLPSGFSFLEGTVKATCPTILNIVQ